MSGFICFLFVLLFFFTFSHVKVLFPTLAHSSIFPLVDSHHNFTSKAFILYTDQRAGGYLQTVRGILNINYFILKTNPLPSR